MNVINYVKYFYYVCDEKDLESIICYRDFFTKKETYFACNYNKHLFNYYIKKNNINNPYVIILSRSILNHKDTDPLFYDTLHDIACGETLEECLFNNTVEYERGDKKIVVERDYNKTIFDTTDPLAELMIKSFTRKCIKYANDTVVGYFKYEEDETLDINKIILNSTYYEIDKEFDISVINFNTGPIVSFSKDDCVYNEQYGYGYVKSCFNNFIDVHFFDFKEERTIKASFLYFVGKLDYDRALIKPQIKHHDYVPKSKDPYFKKMIKLIDKEEKALEDIIDFKNSVDKSSENL